MKQQSGFTLVELVVVIVILGILAATALPRFINLTNDAVIATVEGVAGGLRSAVVVVQARFITNNDKVTPVTMFNGTKVEVDTNTGNPIGKPEGIANAMSSTEGLTIVYNSSTQTIFYPTKGGNEKCAAWYNSETGDVVTITAGC